uniref:PABS domain-containing protein n=2 Tax=Glycine subgen. Soja TaxID=1462606 RepID=I1JZX5_SOYBN
MEHLKTYPAFPGWYADVSWPGEAHIYKMEKILFHGKSEFQELLVFETSRHGKIAIPDGYIQLTENDEFAYQEMLIHLALCSIPNPKKGGDGGILREISRHSSVEHIDICEIDKMVIHVYKKFFPDIAVGYEDPRMHVHIRDGVAFINSVPEGAYDVIILDAFPAMGHSADVLADKCFLESIAKALRPRGVLLWHTNSEVADTIANCKIFKGSVNYAWATVPAYVSGAIGFMLCSTEGPPVNFKHPINKLNPEKNGVAKGPPKFYNSEIHATAFFCGQGWLIQQDIHK